MVLCSVALGGGVCAVDGGGVGVGAGGGGVGGASV